MCRGVGRRRGGGRMLRRRGGPASAICLLLALLSCGCGGERYDRDAITFSPDGSLLQVDYAARAVGSSSLCVGLRCKDGVVLAVDRLIPKADAALLARQRRTAAGRLHPVSRIHRVDDGTAMLVAGMPADGLSVAEQARREARLFRQQFGEEAPGRSVASAVASYLHDCATRADRRVLASAAIIASLVDGRPELFSVDTFACLLQCRGAAFGTQSAEVREELAKRALWDKTCLEAVKEVVDIMAKVAAEEGEADVQHSVEVAYLSDESGGRLVRDPPLPQPEG